MITKIETFLMTMLLLVVSTGVAARNALATDPVDEQESQASDSDSKVVICRTVKNDDTGEKQVSCTTMDAKKFDEKFYEKTMLKPVCA